MARCRKCGKSGLFLKTNIEGMCPDCQEYVLRSLRAALSPEQKEEMQLKERLQILRTQAQEIEGDINARTQQLYSLKIELEKKKAEI